MNIEIRKVEKEELLGSLINQLKEVYAEFFKTTSSFLSSNFEKELKERLTSQGFQEHWFLAFDNDRIVGFSILHHKLPVGKSGYFEVFVLPAFYGTDKKLMKVVIQKAHEIGILEIQTSTFSRQNWDLIEEFGGKVLNSSTKRKLNLKIFNWSFVDSWLSINKGAWIVKKYIRISNDLVDEIADLSFDACNEVWSMDGLRTDNDKAGHIAWLKSLDGYSKSSGDNYIIFTVSLKDSGVIGFIEGSINNSEPDFFLQRLVAVRMEHRGKGIGKYLKALMLNDLRKNHPEVTKVKTTNSDNNFPVVAINQKLGFEIIGTYKEFSLDINKTIITMDTK